MTIVTQWNVTHALLHVAEVAVGIYPVGRLIIDIPVFLAGVVLVAIRLTSNVG